MTGIHWCCIILNIMDPSRIELWRNIFSELKIPESQWHKFQNYLTPMEIKKDCFLIHQGDMPQKIAFIVSGLFRAYYTTEDGDEKTIVFRGAGKPVSAYSSHVKNQAAKFSIQALEDSIVLNISIKDFEELLTDHPFWKEVTSQYYMSLFIEKEKREKELMSDDAETRYNTFLKEYPGLIDRIQHYHIASYLGISNVTLSRIRHKND